MLLELGEANPYSQRAYRRAAETVRASAAPVEDLVRSGRVRRLRGIGASIESKLRELVETGSIAELEELERDLPPGLVGFGRYLGIGARRSIDIAQALGVRTVEELREAAAAGRLRDVPGIGPKVEARLRTALEHGGEPVAPVLDLNRARELEVAIASALEGLPAGDVRRWSDAPAQLAVVCEARDPAPVLRRFAGLPQIVALVEEGERRAVGVTIEGVAIEVVVAEPERLGTALVRATGSPAYVAALEPLPEARDEPAVYAALGIAWCPPGAARGAVRRPAAGARRAGRDPRRPALPHDVVGRARERGGDGPRRDRTRVRVPRDLRPHPGGRRRQGADRRRRPPSGRRDRGGQRGARAVPGPARDRVRHPARRPPGPPRRRPRGARLGPGERPRRAADAARGDDPARRGGDPPPLRRRV